MGGNKTKKLPDGWRWEKIKTVINDDIQIFSPENRGKEKFFYIDISSVDSANKKILKPDQIFVEDAPSRAKSILKENDIILSTVRPNLNAVALVNKNHIGHVCSSGFCVIRLGTGHYAPYFFHYLTSPHFVETVSKMVQGAMYPAISNNDVKNFAIPLPPTIDDQIRIASELGYKMVAVETMREAALRQKEAVAAMQGAILRDAFPHKEGDEMPEGWRWVELDKMSTNIQYGISKSSASDKVGPKLLRITDIQNGKVDWDNVPFCECSENEEKQYTLENSDIVFARTGATTGKSFLVNNPKYALFASYLIRVQCDKKLVNPNYLYIFFQSPTYWNCIDQGARGGTLAGFNATMLSKIEIPLPPTTDDQIRIASELERKMTDLDKIRQAAESQLEAIEALPGAILREVFDFEEDT